MKVIVAGSRTLSSPKLVEQVITTALNKWMADDPDNWQDYCRPEIVSGGAQGVDFCGELYAKKAGLKCTVMPAEWDKYGKAAGMIRNRQMGDYADALIAVWDGESRGTKGMINYMNKLGKLVFVHEEKNNQN